MGTTKEAGGRARSARGRFARKDAQENGGAGAEVETGEPAEEKKRVRCIRTHAERQFREQFPAVCAELLKKAKLGGIRETKLLMEIGGFGDAKAAKRRGKSLSTMLLDELKRRQDEREAAADAAADGRATEMPSAETSSAGTGETNGGGAASVSEIEIA